MSVILRGDEGLPFVFMLRNPGRGRDCKRFWEIGGERRGFRAVWVWFVMFRSEV